MAAARCNATETTAAPHPSYPPKESTAPPVFFFWPFPSRPAPFQRPKVQKPAFSELPARGADFTAPTLAPIYEPSLRVQYFVQRVLRSRSSSSLLFSSSPPHSLPVKRRLALGVASKRKLHCRHRPPARHSPITYIGQSRPWVCVTKSAQCCLTRASFQPVLAPDSLPAFSFAPLSSSLSTLSSSFLPGSRKRTKQSIQSQIYPIYENAVETELSCGHTTSYPPAAAAP